MNKEMEQAIKQLVDEFTKTLYKTISKHKVIEFIMKIFEVKTNILFNVRVSISAENEIVTMDLDKHEEITREKIDEIKKHRPLIIDTTGEKLDIIIDKLNELLNKNTQ